MITEHLYKRLTHKYVDSCRDLDRQDYVCSLPFTPQVQTQEPTDYDDGGTYVRFARMPGRTTRREKQMILQAARDTFNHSGCHHEYDCCGCASYRSTVTLSGRNIRVETRVGYNY